MRTARVRVLDAEEEGDEAAGGDEARGGEGAAAAWAAGRGADAPGDARGHPLAPRPRARPRARQAGHARNARGAAPREARAAAQDAAADADGGLGAAAATAEDDDDDDPLAAPKLGGPGARAPPEPTPEKPPSGYEAVMTSILVKRDSESRASRRGAAGSHVGGRPLLDVARARLAELREARAEAAARSGAGVAAPNAAAAAAAASGTAATAAADPTQPWAAPPSKPAKDWMRIFERKTSEVEVFWVRKDRGAALTAVVELVDALLSSRAAAATGGVRDVVWVRTVAVLDAFAMRAREHMSESDNRVNWRHRTARVRGLVARLYVQAALRLEPVEVLAPQAAGISDALANAFCRAYLARVACVDLEALQRGAAGSAGAASGDEDPRRRAYLDLERREAALVRCVRELWSAPLPRKLSPSLFVVGEHLPAALALLYASAAQAMGEPATFLSVFAEEGAAWEGAEPMLASRSRWRGALWAASEDVVADHAPQVAKRLGVAPDFENRSETFSSLARKWVRCPPSRETALSAMNSVFIDAVVNRDDPVAVLEMTASFIELCAAHYGERDVLVLLRDMDRRVKASTVPRSRIAGALGRVCDAVAARALMEGGFNGKLLRSEAFASLFAAAPPTVEKGALTRRLLSEGLGRGAPALDRVAVSAAMFFARDLHDTHLASLHGETEQVNQALTRFVERVAVGSQELSLLAECRTSFSKCAGVARVVCLAALRMAWGVGRASPGAQGLRRAGAGVRRGLLASGAAEGAVDSCLAFCLATVASFSDPWTRGSVCVQAGLTAGATGRVLFLDSFFRAAVGAVSEGGPRCAELVGLVAGALIVVPAPNGAPMFWVRALVAAAGQGCADPRGGDAGDGKDASASAGAGAGAKAQARALALAKIRRGRARRALEDVVQALADRQGLPYALPGVVSNEELFGDVLASDAFAREVGEVRRMVVERLGA